MSSALADAWQRQIAWCDKGGSPFTARVLEAAWGDWLTGGTLRELIPDWPRDPVADAVALRVAGALHALVLDDVDPALAALYPPRSGAFDPIAGPGAVRAALRTHRAHLSDYLQRPPQTNEVGRSAILLGGFATIAARTALPLALRELGASAGLNLLWFRYQYQLGPSVRWGDPASPVTIACDWRGSAPPLPPRIDVTSWRGCDKTPIDLTASHAATRLASYVWPDQRDRLQRLQAAIALAKAEAVEVEREDAAVFVARELGARRNGETTVFYHSIVWQYLDPATRRTIRDLIAEAGAHATPEAPLAWLTLEVRDARAIPRLALTLWPGGERITLGEGHPHGRYLHWAALESERA